MGLHIFLICHHMKKKCLQRKKKVADSDKITCGVELQDLAVVFSLNLYV